MPLDWWPNHDLFLAGDPMWEPVCAAWVLERDGRMVRLDGTSPPIHKLNEKIGPEINRENAIAYLEFFCAFVQAEEGPFRLIGSISDEILPLEIDREKIEAHVREPQLLKEGSNPEGELTFDIEAMVFYSDALFLSNFHIQPTGMVEMLEDEPVASELGAKIKMPLKFVDPATVKQEGSSDDTVNASTQEN